MARSLFTALCFLVPLITSAQDRRESPIDAHLQQAWNSAGMEPAPLCSDELYLRRLTLDLIGRIPTTAERQAFLAQPDRSAAVARLLASPEYARFWGELWTTQLIGYDNNNGDRDTLAQWLQEQFQQNRPYDQLVDDLLTSTGESAFDGSATFLLRYGDEPVIKVSRAFLGIRLDCARCHDHPFDRWTQADFQRMNRFFDATERREIAANNVRLVDVVREVTAEDRPRFLSGAEPRTTQWRKEFSLFLTHSRPFARNFANRLWYHFLGRGIVHPVDDVSQANPPAIPELLEYLADEAQRHHFDIEHMIGLICDSQAYQRVSIASLKARSNESKNESTRQRLFAVRTIKPLTPEQWYDSMCVATDRVATVSERDEFRQVYFGGDLNADYSATWEYRESIQGLMARLVAPQRAPARSIDELFVRFLGRLPTDHERQQCVDRSLDEVGFVLLHSSEFGFNH